MSNLTEKRLKEMEDEMNRFEEEILSTKAAEAAAAADHAKNARKMIIGASTYTQVQAKISTIAGPSLPPTMISNNSSIGSGFNLRPPPPPPAFRPHQLHRPMPPPRPPFPPRGLPPGPPGMPQRMMPSNPPNYPHPNMMNRPPGNFMSSSHFRFSQNPMPSNASQSNSTFEKPKIVYSAPPVKRVVTTDAVMTQNLPKTATATKAPIKESGSEKKKSLQVVEQVKKQVLPGIELNVPVEEIEAEKKLHFHASISMHSTSMEVDQKESTSHEGTKKKEKKKKFVRMAAGTTWEDQTLGEWEQDDFRLFCGDLGNEVMDETLARAFSKYPSFIKAKVIRDKKSTKTKGFGFVSFKDPNDFMKAMREMNGKYVGNRPIKLRKSCWKDRQIDIVKKKDKEKKRLGFR